jgi:AcrR family transcriptional regulator
MAARTAPKKKQARKATAPYHHGDLRRALVVAAREELHEVGRDALSLRAVARRAGVSHTAAYHHFTDKAALLAEIAADGFVALDASMRDAIDAAGPDPLARLQAAGRGYVAMAQADPAAYDLMFNGRDMASSQTLQQVAPLSFLRLSAAVAAARAHVGLTDAADDDHGSSGRTDAFILWQAVHGFAMLRLSGQLEPFGIVPEEHLERVLHRLTDLFRYPPRHPSR